MTGPIHAALAASDGLPLARRRLAMLSVFCAVALSVVSTTSVSVALPVISRELGISAADAVWLVNGFQLTLLATLFPCAAIAEKWGLRRCFLAGLVLIGLSSLACALARSLPALLAARVVQALGASMVMAVNPALLRLSVPHADLGRAIGWNAMVVATMTALGPSLAALVLSALGWPWLFSLNLPFVLLAMVLGAAALPADTPSAARRFDTVGAFVNMASFVLVAGALDAVAARAWRALPLGLGAVACGIALVRQQRGREAPLLPLDLLRVPVVRGCAVALLFGAAAQMAALVCLPFLLHDALGLSMLDTGTLMMAWPLTVGLMAPAAGGWLARATTSAGLCATGGGLLAAGLLALALMPHTVGRGGWLAAMVLCGLGYGCFQTPNNRSLIAATPRSRSGSAGSLQATSRMAGQTLGATTVGMAFRLVPQAHASAVSWALLAAALFALLSAVSSWHRR